MLKYQTKMTLLKHNTIRLFYYNVCCWISKCYTTIIYQNLYCENTPVVFVNNMNDLCIHIINTLKNTEIFNMIWPGCELVFYQPGVIKPRNDSGNHTK